MNKETILTNLQAIHEGKQIDGRTLRSLKRNGYVDRSGLLSSWGFRTLGVYKHIPQLPIIDPADYRGRNAAITESIFSECSCCGHHNDGYDETYTISVEKLAEVYNEYAERVNDYVKEHCWDHTLDEGVETGFAPRGIERQMLRLAEDRVSMNDFHYTWHIFKQLMSDVIKGNTKSYTSTSYKYSITDTVDEIRDLITDGPADFSMTVEVNR